MKFYSFDFDLDPMTLILKLYLDMIKMYVLPSAVQKLSSEQTYKQTHRHIDRHTDSTEIIKLH